MNDVKNSHSRGNTPRRKQHSSRKRGKAQTFKSETNFTCQVEVPASDSALLADPLMQAPIVNENEVSHLRINVRS